MQAPPTATDGEADLLMFARDCRGAIVEDWSHVASLGRLPPVLAGDVGELVGHIAEVAQAIARGEAVRARPDEIFDRIANGHELPAVVSELSLLRRSILEVWARERPGGCARAREALDLAIDRAIVTAVTRSEHHHRRIAREREAALAELESLLAAAPAGIAFIDRDLRYVRVNQAFAELAGRATADHVGRHVREVQPEQAALLEPALARLLATGEPFAIELDGAAPGVPDARSFVASFFPVRAPTGVVGVGCMVTEVTEARRIQEQLRVALRSREELLAIVSHDLRNPLGTIVLGSALIQPFVPEGPARKHLERIERAARSMEALIGDLLDTATIHTGRLALALERVEAAELVTEAIDLHGPQAEERAIAIRRELALDGAALRCDRERVLQVFGNLIGNALKFCAAGDTITIGGEPAGDQVRFWVSDSGPGVAPELVPHLFEPFVSSPDHVKHGAGLGLYITKGIVEGHGGHLEVDTAPGRGTTFTFTLPVVR